MISRFKPLEVNGWGMIAHVYQPVDGAKWSFSITSLKKGIETLPDWKDADRCFNSEEAAIKAAIQWAQLTLK